MNQLNINEYNKFLPLGSVVLLSGAVKPLLVIGYLIKDDNDCIRDYAGIPYPEGLVNNEAFRLFNHEDIGELLFFGMYGNIFMNYEKGLLKVNKDEK